MLSTERGTSYRTGAITTGRNTVTCARLAYSDYDSALCDRSPPLFLQHFTHARELDVLLGSTIFMRLIRHCIYVTPLFAGRMHFAPLHRDCVLAHFVLALLTSVYSPSRFRL